MGRTTAITLPETSGLLVALGNRLRAARLRRGLSAALVASRAGMSLMTLRAIERGKPNTTIGAYLSVLQTLGLEKGLAQVAADDPLGRSLQDSAARQRAPRSKRATGVRLPFDAAENSRGKSVPAGRKSHATPPAKRETPNPRKPVVRPAGHYTVRRSLQSLTARARSGKPSSGGGVPVLADKAAKHRTKATMASGEAPSRAVSPDVKRGVHSDDLLKLIRVSKKA
jgi:transcriptional regulator with XRE-family HTH domain